MEDFEKNQKKYTPHQAKIKIENYCVYQERAQQEVRDKLYDWGLYATDVENIISNLISDNFLNEERFARAYVRGKFRIKDWGRIKIIQHLKTKRVSLPIIKIAITEIDIDDYLKKIESLILKKVNDNTKKLSYPERIKIMRYMHSKGFENDLVINSLNKLF